MLHILKRLKHEPYVRWAVGFCQRHSITRQSDVEAVFEVAQCHRRDVRTLAYFEDMIRRSTRNPVSLLIWMDAREQLTCQNRERGN